MNFERHKARSALRGALSVSAASALALVASQAHAQSYYYLNGATTSTSASPTGTTCPTGTTAGFVLASNAQTGTQTDCASYDNTSTATYNSSGSYGTNGQTNGYNYYDYGSASTAFTTSEVTTTNYDFSTNPATETTSTAAPVQVGTTSTTDVQINTYGYTTVGEISNYGTYSYTGTTNGQASAYSYSNYVDAGTADQSYSYGTLTYNQNANALVYTANSGGSHYSNVEYTNYETWDGNTYQGTTQDASGFTAYDSAGNSTTLSATGISSTNVTATTMNVAQINGAGTDGALVLHGGTASTTVTLDNSGMTVADTTNGTTFSVSNTGNGAFAGGLTVAGTTTTHGIVNTGNISTGTLSTSGAATLNSAAVTNNLTVGGTTTLTGALTANGGISTTTLSTSGAATLNSATVTNALSVGTNLTVGGTTTLTGALAANGGVTTTSLVATGNVSTATGSVTAGNVVINGSNGGKISGLTNAALSSTSTEAVTGQQLYATNSALTTLTGRVDVLASNMVDLRKKAYQGVAMGFAMNAAPLNLANGEKGMVAGVGVYQGEVAGAIKAQYVSSTGIGLGANVGFSKDAVGGGVGASVKF